MDERIRAYARLRLERAREELETASENIANGHFRAAISRAYYAVFYMASAALFSLEDHFDFLGPDAIRIKGHRLGIEHVLEYYQAGYTADEIAKEFPGLSLEKIHATITYYLCHRTEVDAYLTRLRELKEREYQEWLANPSPIIKRLQAIKAQRVESSLDEGCRQKHYNEFRKGTN